MDYLTVFLIATSLSFDSFAASLSFGLCQRKILFSRAMKVAFTLALFQGGLPFIGWLLGETVNDYIKAWDHWVAFGLLVIIGGRVIYENARQGAVKKPLDPSKWSVIIITAIATSIDALIVGFTFSLVEINILITGVIIGAITFLASMIGIFFGKKAAIKYGTIMEIIGGLILMGIGTKILIQHLYFQ